MPQLFTNRVAAGRSLGEKLARLGLAGKVLVLGLPRGGIPVACEVAAALHAPVDALIVRKLGAPFNPELALGAIAFGGVTVYNGDLLAEFGLQEKDIAPIRARELQELDRRERAYRENRFPLDVSGATVVIVDDGMATGATMHAAVAAIRALGPARVADRVVALATPEPYYGVGAWYAEFPQLTDAEVIAALAEAARSIRPAGPKSRSAAAAVGG